MPLERKTRLEIKKVDEPEKKPPLPE